MSRLASMRPLVAREPLLWLLLTAASGAAIALASLSTWRPIGLFVLLLFLVTAGDFFSVTLPGDGSLTPMASGLVLAMMFLGPLPAAALALGSSLVDGARRGIGRRSTVANSVSHVSLAAGLGAIAHTLTNDLRAFDAVPFIVGGVGYLVVSAFTFIWLVWSWSTDSLRMRFKQQYLPLLLPELLVALLTGGAAELYSRSDEVSLGIVAAAILVFGYVARQLQLHEARGRDLEELAMAQQVLLGKLSNAEASHRRTLARELHDGPLQALLAARQDAAEVAMHPERASYLESALAATIKDLRDATLRLHPAPLRELGFELSVARLAQLLGDRHQIDIGLSISCAPSDAVEELAYAAISELLTNVGKHAGARSATVSAREHAGVLSIAVEDDGRGFDQDDRMTALADGHVGLAALRERVRDRGGRVEFDALEPGARVTVWLPR
jgi:signal transduction histidine kinase